MVFIVVISSVLLAVCTSLKPIYLQNAIDAVDAGADGALTMFLCYVASILGILLFETARQLSTGEISEQQTVQPQAEGHGAYCLYAAPEIPGGAGAELCHHTEQ